MSHNMTTLEIILLIALCAVIGIVIFLVWVISKLHP